MRGFGFEPATAAGSAETDRADSVYEQGMMALDERQWDRAIELFDEVVRLNGNRSDRSLYWKAYAQNKQGRRHEAMDTITILKKRFPKSRWISEARALEIEMSQASGSPVRPEDEADEDLKLIAINALMQSNAEQAIPMLQRVLQSSQSPKLKERALFVLAQSGSPKAREAIIQIARGQANPDLQSKAVHYLGLFGGMESRKALADIYASSSDVHVKRTILRSFMIAGERDRLVAALKAWIDSELEGRRIVDCLEPRPEDFVISTGEQLHRLCRHEGIVHLFYCGFAANMCVPGRDYGMRAFQRRGYNLVLLRDCTSAIEAGSTYDAMALTEAAILEVA